MSPRPSTPPSPSPEDYAFARLLAFNRYMWPGFDVAAVHRCIARHVEAVERREIRNLLITMPPRHSKTETVTKSAPAWYLGRNPSDKVMVASYAQGLADDFGRANRNKMEDPRFQAIFKGVRIPRDSHSVQHFEVINPKKHAERGEFNALGIQGGGTGKGADLLIIDDPIKNREQAESKAVIQQVTDWYSDVAQTRMSPRGVQILIMTRWVDNDLAGHVLKGKGARDWVHLNLPALAEEPNDLLGRAMGEALWPERYSRANLEEKRDRLPDRTWAALYQQRPVPKSGNYVKAEWFARRRFGTAPYRPWRIVQSWDTARKDAEWNDPTVCTTWAETEAGYYLLDVFSERLKYPGLRRACKSLAERWEPDLILVEDSANGTALVDDLEAETRLPFLLVSTDGLSKEMRLDSVTDLMEGALVWLPDSAAWLPEFETELLRFPAAPHDDQVDSVSQALRWFKSKRRSGTSESDLILSAPRDSVASDLDDY